MTPEQQALTLQRLTALVGVFRRKPKNSKKKATKDEAGSGDVVRGVQGLAAMVLAYPYKVPDSVCGAIEVLTKHTGNPDVRKIITWAFGEFRRTHEDEWDVHQQRFDPQVLDAFNDSFESP